MTYMAKQQDISEQTCPNCDFEGDVEIVTEWEDRHVTQTWVCPGCGYVEVVSSYDDDPELGFSPDEWNDFQREQWD